MTCILLCPGQGAQTVGMAKELIEAVPEVKDLYYRASEILGWDIACLCLEGPAEELNRTDRTQPALYLHACAAIDRLKHAGIAWHAAAGHSAGEYAALYALGVWSFEDGLRIIAERARLMYEAGLERGGTMAVCLGLHPDRIAEVCSGIDNVVLANRNAPNQGVISGSVEGVTAAGEALKAAGAKRVLPLKVSGAFHSPFMQPARERFTEFLAGRSPDSFQPPRGVWVSNRTGGPESDPAVIRESLAVQLTSPVHWIETMAWAAAQPSPCFIEAGTGNVLRGLLKTNGIEAPTWGAATPDEIQTLTAEMKS